MKTVLVTGATGFLGKNVIPLLLHEDCTVTAIVRNAASCDVRVRAIVADLTDAESMQRIRKDIEDTDVLVHLAAAMPTPGSSPEEQKRVQQEQVNALHHLLSALPARCRHIVYSSSIDVFGVPETLPIDERHPTNPITEYGRAKLEGEKVLQAFCKRTDRSLSILRITQIYGQGEPVIKAIPLFLQAVRTGKAPTLFGDGSDLRDYINVADAARAVTLATMREKDGTMIIASGTSVTLLSVLETIIAIAGKALKPELRDRAKAKIDFRFDVSKARLELGFEALIPLSKGLQMQYDAMQP